MVFEFFANLAHRSGATAGGDQVVVRCIMTAKEQQRRERQGVPVHRRPEYAAAELRWRAAMSVTVGFFEGLHGGITGKLSIMVSTLVASIA